MKRQDLRIGNWVRFNNNANYDCTIIQALYFEGNYIEKNNRKI